jgi:Mrp family chromosome partitioning ATPase/capsular polysaccharide biosynthesis protein
MAVWTLICAGLALAYCLLATPKYLASTDVVLEPRQPVITTDPGAQSTAPTLDSALADSQVQVLQSERNLKYVFDVQHLETDPEFAQSGFDPIGWLLNRLPFLAQSPMSPEAQAERNRQMAFEKFANQVSVKRLAQSYAFELSFYADSPAKATKLANAITAAYIRDKVLYNITAAEAQRGGDFLQNRVADTKAEQDAAAEAVKTGVIPDFVFGHADARIISSAVEPLKNAYPRTTLILALAIAFGAISSVAGVIVADELDRRVRSARRLQALTGLTALAALPVVKTARRDPAALLTWARSAPDSRFAAEIRKLRVAALQIADDGKPIAIGVLSYGRGEGRSVIAANLAALIAESGTPAALVDGDIFDPSLTAAFAAEAKRGLVDGFSSDLGPVPCLPLEHISHDLVIMPARSLSSKLDPNRVVGLSPTSAACAALAESRFVVVDLPPVSESPEGVAIASSLAGVIVVVDAATVSVDEFLELLDRLAENDVQVLGVALNKVVRW